MWLVGGMLEPIFNNSLWQIRLTTRLLTVSWEQCHYTTITVWSWRCWRLKMMHLTIAALSVFMFLQVASGQTPPRPNLSNSFSAEVHVNVHSFSMKQESQHLVSYLALVQFRKRKHLPALTIRILSKQVTDLGPGTQLTCKCCKHGYSMLHVCRTCSSIHK